LGLAGKKGRMKEKELRLRGKVVVEAKFLLASSLFSLFWLISSVLN